MNRNFLVYLRDMLENMEDAGDFVRGMSFEQFQEDKKTINAVLRSIEVIGEASKRVPDAIREKYADIPWKEMAGMRDKVIHAYASVDLETVWVVVKERFPTLRPLLEQVVREAEQPLG